MGVFRASSCLMTSRKPGAGLRGSSDGKVADRGVFNPAGRADRGVFRLGRLGIRIVGVLRAGKVDFGEVDGMVDDGDDGEMSMSIHLYIQRP